MRNLMQLATKLLNAISYSRQICVAPNIDKFLYTGMLLRHMFIIGYCNTMPCPFSLAMSRRTLIRKKRGITIRL